MERECLLLQAEQGAVKDRADRHRELLAAAFALVDARTGRLALKPALARAYLTLTRTFALVVIPFAGLSYPAAPWLVGWLYPERWQDSIDVMRALCVTATATGLNPHPGLVWLALGDTRLRLRWSLYNLVAIVAVILLGLPHGAVGVAYALAARSLLATVVAQVITKRKTGVGHRDYALAVAPGLALGLVFYVLAMFAVR